MHASIGCSDIFHNLLSWVEVENKNASLNITPTPGKSKKISLFFNKKSRKNACRVYPHLAT